MAHQKTAAPSVRAEPSPPRSVHKSSIKIQQPQIDWNSKAFLSHLAFKVGHFELGCKLQACCSDFVVYRTPSGEYKHALLPCGHRLCPHCAHEKTRQLRTRLSSIYHRAHTFLTFTFRTLPGDYRLGDYLDRLSLAMRSLSNRAPRKWTPFGDDGYFWKLEVTDSPNCYHPHIHALSCAHFIPHAKLAATWVRCLRAAGLEGGQVWIRSADHDALLEISKYLAKGLASIPPHRWRDLDNGLKNKRAYASAGRLRLPTLPKQEKNRLVGFGSRWQDDPIIEAYCMLHRPHYDLNPQSDLRRELKSHWNLIGSAAPRSYYRDLLESRTLSISKGS